MNRNITILFVFSLVIFQLPQSNYGYSFSVYNDCKIKYAKCGYSEGSEDTNYVKQFNRYSFISDQYSYNGLLYLFLSKENDLPMGINANVTSFQFLFELNKYSYEYFKIFSQYDSFNVPAFVIGRIGYNESIGIYQIYYYYGLTDKYYYIDLNGIANTLTLSIEYQFTLTDKISLNWNIKENNYFEAIVSSDTYSDRTIWFKLNVLPRMVSFESLGYYYESQYTTTMLRSFRILYSYSKDLFGGYIDTFIADNYQEIEKEYSGSWKYNSFSIIQNIDSNMTFSSFNISYPLIEVEQTERVFYYTNEFVSLSSWGDWGLFDWLRRGLIIVVNAISIAIQFLLYLLTLAFNYLIIGFFSFIIVLIWNYVIYYVFYAICYIANIFYSFFAWAWDVVSDFFEKIIDLLPLTSDGIKAVFLSISQFLIIAFSFVSTALLWVISLGSIDFNVLFEKVLFFTENMYLSVANAFETLVEFLPYLAVYAIFYMNLLLMLYLKIIYTKMRGYTNRSMELQKSLDGYMEVFRFSKEVILFIRNLIPIV